MRPCATGVPWVGNLRSLVFQQASGLALPTNPSAWWTLKSMEEEERRERRRRQRQQVVGCCKQLAAFLFSHIGLAAMVVAYSIMGGFLFRAIEAPEEKQVKLNVIRHKEAKIAKILDAVRQVCGGWEETPQPLLKGGRRDWTVDVEGLNETLRTVFAEFQLEVKVAVKDMGWDGNDDMDESALQWSLAGAILYAVTVITTIGYGHIAPKTIQGRMLTILYALIGIPLTFLYLSNIGNFLADCFRLFYKRICCDIICCQKCERKRKRERLKLRRRRELAAQRNILLGMHSELLADLSPDLLLLEEGVPRRWRVEEGEDLDRRWKKESPEVLGAVGGSPAGGDNPGYNWETHSVETVHSDASCPSPTSNNQDEDYEDNELEEVEEEEEDGEEDDDDEVSGSTVTSEDRGSVETVRETAIIEDDAYHERHHTVRETAIVDASGDLPSSSSRSHRSAVRPRGDRANTDRTRTPSFHANNGFHLLDASKETDIIRGDSSSAEGGSSRHSRDFQRRSSDPFFHNVPGSHSREVTGPNRRCPASAGVGHLSPTRSPTVRPEKTAPRKQSVEYCRQGHSAPSRSEQNQRSVSSERWRTKVAAVVAGKTPPSAGKATSPFPGKDPQDRAKANWKKLIEYTKQLAEKERLERTGKPDKKEVSEKKKKRGKTKEGGPLPEARNRWPEAAELAKRSLMFRRNAEGVDNSNSERRTRRIAVKIPQRKFSGESWNPPDSMGATSPVGRIVRSPFHRSEESFVTAVDDSRSSSEGAGTGPGSDDCHSDQHRRRGRRMMSKCPSHSANSVAIDMGSPSDDPDYPDFIQGDQPMSFLDDPFDYEEDCEEQEGKVTVPISICLIIISGYLFAGSALFAVWEQWDMWTGSYFCFITLSTIGFGDIVPGTDMKEWASEAKLVLCALWLAFGLSLLAMCFNLMQEEVKDKCKWIGQKLGLLKDEGQT